MSVTEIREATEHDLESIVALYEASGLAEPGEISPEKALTVWQRTRQYPSYRFVVAWNGPVAVGTLALLVMDNLAHGGTPSAVVEGVAVHPSAQGQGVGRALMAWAHGQAAAAGCYKVALSSNVKRTAAHRFYESLGYERQGYAFVVKP